MIQVFDDQMYPLGPWPNHAKIETPLARALIMMYYLVHDNLSLKAIKHCKSLRHQCKVTMVLFFVFDAESPPK